MDARLDRTLLTRIVESGHSRIPVYEGQRENIIGILLSKVSKHDRLEIIH
jgi:metal transporter CNNM